MNKQRKVKFFASDLIMKFLAKEFAFASIFFDISLIFINDFDAKVAFLGVIFIISMPVCYWRKWKKANELKKIEITINNSTVEIFEGDLFEQDGIKIIAFNEYLDTEVSDKIISKDTLNGIYLKQYVEDIDNLNKKMTTNVHLREKQCGEEINRKNGKKIKYQLGTIFPNGNYFLLAFSHFDNDNRAWITMPEYISCLLEMWNEIDKFYNGKTVVLPILGSGITRFKEGYLSEQELVEMLLLSLKLSKVKFEYPSRVQIIIYKNDIDKMNLHKIKQEFD